MEWFKQWLYNFRTLRRVRKERRASEKKKAAIAYRMAYRCAMEQLEDGAANRAGGKTVAQLFIDVYTTKKRYSSDRGILAACRDFELKEKK